MPRLALRVLSRARRRLGGEGGFTLIEAVLAMAIFATVSTALAGVLTSSITARSLASERTAAEQEANDQIEWIRTIDYADVGVPGGNPKGIVDPTGDQSAQGGPTVPARYTVSVTVKWVNDPTPTSYASKANYKNVTVTVLRASSGKQLSQQSTQIGPRQRAPFGGIDKGTVIVTVQDYLAPSNPRPGIPVNLTTGPSATLSDVTDGSGQITFPSLDPTPSSGPTANYGLSLPVSAGYVVLPIPVSTTLFPIAAAQTLQKTLQIYKPVTLTFQPQNSDGTPFSSAATFTVTGPEGTGTFTYNSVTGAAITVTSLTKSGTSVLLPPGSYTITPASGMYADPVTLNVPENLSDYPGDLTGQANATSDPLGTISVTAQQSSGTPVVGATVTVGGGPRSIAAQSATTNASGVATFTGLPAGSGYNITATKGSLSASPQTASVGGGSTTNITMTFPTGSLKAVVAWATVPVVGATVTLTGGPGSVNVTGTSDVNGEVLFSNIPTGSGYTMTATKSGQSAVATPSVTTGSTTTVPIAMPTVTLVATVTWASLNVTGANVTLSGGPMSLTPLSATTSVSGQVTFNNVPAGSGYTLAATKNGQTTTLTSQTFTTSPTTNVDVALPTGTVAVNAATWAGQPVGGATVSISGGPNSPATYSGTTNASGVANVTVPATTSSYPYTVTVTKTAGSTTGSGAASVTSLASGATATVSPALTPTGTISVTATWAGQTAGSANVSITGGPNSGATYSGTTNASGVASVTVPITNSSFPYTVTVTKNGGSGNSTVNTVTAAGPNSTAVALGTKTLTLRIFTGSAPGTVYSNSSVSVSITGGPNGTNGAAPSIAWTGTTTSGGSGGYTAAITVPAGSGNFLVKVAKNACPSSGTNRSTGSGATTGTSVSADATTTSANIYMNQSSCPTLP